MLAARCNVWPFPAAPARANAAQVLALVEALHDDQPAAEHAAPAGRLGPRVPRQVLKEIARRNDPHVRIGWEDRPTGPV